MDAVLCAYVALYSVRRPDDVTIYGDADTGYILTPTLPADLLPQRSEPRSRGRHGPRSPSTRRGGPAWSSRPTTTSRW